MRAAVSLADPLMAPAITHPPYRGEFNNHPWGLLPLRGEPATGPDDEAEHEWLGYLLDAYHQADIGVTKSIQVEEEKGKIRLYLFVRN